MKKIRFIDLFAGLGGTRLGFESACIKNGLQAHCVFTSEIKEHAITVYKKKFQNCEIHGDITEIKSSEIPDFDYLLAGFPCQPFSAAGSRKGFLDPRGGLFFSILSILKDKIPAGFLLENVEGLVNHDNGKTLKRIVSELEKIDYNVTFKVLDSSNFGVPQVRKRIYIVGHKKLKPNLDEPSHVIEKCDRFIEYDVVEEHSAFAKKLLTFYSLEELKGKCIKDKRGGIRNIHSWDIDYKGKTSVDQKKLLNELLKQRRSKKWAIQKGIDWMDGMPLTLDEIKTFIEQKSLEQNLFDLVEKGYIRYEYPKKKVVRDGVSMREYDTSNIRGFNIVTGKLSFPITTIIDPNGFAPTLVATEAGKIAVATDKCLRKITPREGLRFSGYPDSYVIDCIEYNEAFDLIGNTVMPPVIEFVAKNILKNE